jgi:hypothetical protein
MGFCSVRINFSVKFSPFSINKLQKVVRKNVFNYFFQILEFSKVINFQLPPRNLDDECTVVWDWVKFRKYKEEF